MGRNAFANALLGLFLFSVYSLCDWPKFRGPNCTGICTETGLIQSVPPGGPPLLWRLDGLGTGYSSVSISEGKLFTMGDRPWNGKKAQFVIAYDLSKRKELWATRVGPPHSDGPRCTPTVDGNLVFALGTEGDLVCIEASSGRIRWRKNAKKDFGGRMMSGWKYSESPTVDGDKVVFTPGAQDAMIVALNKFTGETIWKSKVPKLGKRGRDGAGYATIVIATIDGVRQYVTTVGRGAIAVEAETGRFLWGYNRIANRVANIPSPIVKGNYVFVTTSYRTGSALLEVRKKGNSFSVKEVWFNGPDVFENHHGGVVLVGDYLYGGSGQNNGIPTCLEFMTGKIAWKAKAPARGSAAVLYADGNLYFRYQKGGVVALIEANPKQFKLKGTFRPPESHGPGWPHPVIDEGKLYLRDRDTLWCYDVKKHR